MAEEMTQENGALQSVPEWLADCCLKSEVAGGELHLTVAPEALFALGQRLRDEPSLWFDYPADLVARDTGEEFVLWYRLHSMEHNQTAIIHVMLPREAPSVSSVTSIWPGMNWHERECFDLFGIEFIGHPDADDPTRMRILLPEDWEGHPFRRDYQPVFSGDPLHGPQALN